MGKKLERNELESLRAQNRKLKKIIQDLKKKANRADKKEERYSDLEDSEILLDSWVEEQVSKYNCPKCKSPLYIIDGSRLRVLICEQCDYRASRKNV